MEVNNLPKEWRNHRHEVTGLIAEDYKRWAKGTPIMAEDDCPCQINVIVVENDHVWRIDSPEITDIILRSLRIPKELRLVNLFNNPPVDLTKAPSSN
ncbi:MAG: hypothetical protein PHW72_00255 [Candidatus Pacebacteria bacterium]|nr:hypothetical protein [Candidatus Paceibacterota bacterium]